MLAQLNDNSSRLFGRAPDLAALHVRATQPGITAVVGGPQTGKSWLLLEFARQLAESPTALVGYTPAPRGAADPMLQVVSDLYQRWLSSAGGWEQLQTAWDQQRETLLPNFGRFVGKLAKDGAKIVPIVGEMLGTAVNEAMIGLTAASDGLKTGGLLLSRLEYVQAQELVDSVWRRSGRRLCLVLDQLEETVGLDQQEKLLREVARNRNDWSGCHILLAAREGTPAAAMARDLAEEYRASVCIHGLELLHLDDPSEQWQLLHFLRDKVPGIRDLDDSETLALVDGYACVVGRLTDELDAASVKTEAGVRDMVEQAHRFHYTTLRNRIKVLPLDQKRLAVRMVLVPWVESADGWRALRPVLMEGFGGATLDALRASEVLVPATEPSFGHPKRWEAAIASFEAPDSSEVAREEASATIFSLARRIRAINETGLPFAAALRGMLAVAERWDLDALPLSLCGSAKSLLDGSGSSYDGLLAGVRAAGAERQGDVLLPLAAAMVNTLVAAKAEDDLPRRDALLAELRALAETHADDAAVRERLANGLFNTLYDAKAEDDLPRRDALLAELRALAKAHADDAAVREQLAKGLFNTLNDAKAVRDLPHRDALLRELRALAKSYVKDAAVRAPLAMGLFNTLIGAKAEDDLPRRDALLAELRALAKAHADDAAAREQLAKGLFNTLYETKGEDDLPRRDALLAELRALAEAHPDDAAVRERLANGLFNTLYDAKAEDDLPRRDALLAELRALAQAHSDDAAVRKWLANGLFNTLLAAKAEDDLPRRDALLAELRALAETHADDAAVRERLANGLFNTLYDANDAKEEDDLPRRDALLAELRALAEAHADDAAVREQLAKGLFNTLNDAGAVGDMPRHDALLAELLSLVEAFPTEPIIRDIATRLGSELP